MLSHYLNERTIKLGMNPQDKTEAIEMGGRLLVDIQKITDGYIAQMLESLKTQGAYMVISPGIALMHARPSENVLEECVSLVTLKTPIEFGHASNDPVDIVFTVAAKEGHGHLGVIKDIAKLMLEGEFTKLLRSTDDVRDVVRFIKNRDEAV